MQIVLTTSMIDIAIRTAAPMLLLIGFEKENAVDRRLQKDNQELNVHSQLSGYMQTIPRQRSEGTIMSCVISIFLLEPP
jgi:hypothetical protein